MRHLLEVKDLNVSYRGADAKFRQAVAGVSFEIGQGEVLGLMGESGCGKTALSRQEAKLPTTSNTEGVRR